MEHAGSLESTKEAYITDQTIATFQRNIYIATLLGATCCMPLATMLRRVAMCYYMLGVVGSNLKMVKFFRQHLWMLRVVVVSRARFVTAVKSIVYSFRSTRETLDAVLFTIRNSCYRNLDSRVFVMFNPFDSA